MSFWWRRRESNPENFVTNGRETSRNVASDTPRGNVSRRNATCHCENANARTTLIAILANQVKALVLAGEVDAAVLVLEAIAELLGTRRIAG